MKRSLQHDEIDQMLSQQGEILPSSGFAASVMGAVRREATAPPPIPFPWKRALPGLVVGSLALAVALVAVVLVLLHTGNATTPAFSMATPSAMLPLFHDGLQAAANWTVVSLLVAFISVKLSMRLASGRA